MIEFSLCCDSCGDIINASKVSAADARTHARLYCGYIRLRGKDLCFRCADDAQKEPHP